MRSLFLLSLAFTLASASAYAEIPQCPKGQSLKDNQCECDDPNTEKKDDGTCGVMLLPNGKVAVGEATNVVGLVPLIAGAGVSAAAALAGGGGGGGGANATGATGATSGTGN
ncbi:hypothetical protein C8J27_101790 [Rhodobacter aestuarii]|uniref:Uncharacterized protein n=1 Tax=Rhodobacter aestuarii TaxID=453582 RepID=A0A1N7P944_9RHOB|nr:MULTISPECIES: hypothetical protein [Rhodobacter]PTV97673.1 hypothetical protein C8J27_101790 [Rhodobacter aestuarii]SIT07103.1 hypothetical protein SAMN05421580_109150 [Rhodobacter aestuarii]SOC04714.1 hypothetical protein SAMN05877809_103275 [Rhodobacter sp. JA431]